MKIKDINGLKYPDDYFIKFFFKENFHKTNKKLFLEFGCSNGNNLILPYQYEHNTIGVDLNNESIDDANEIFSSLNSNNNYIFHKNEMNEFANNNHNIEADVFLLPNLVNYITTNQFKDFLLNMINNNNIKKNADFFIRCRTPKDFRFGIGKNIEHNTYLLDNDYNITGEKGCLNRFYTETELVDILKEYLNLKNYMLFTSDTQNLQSSNIILNSDIIIWGKIN